MVILFVEALPVPSTMPILSPIVAETGSVIVRAVEVSKMYVDPAVTVEELATSETVLPAAPAPSRAPVTKAVVAS